MQEPRNKLEQWFLQNLGESKIFEKPVYISEIKKAVELVDPEYNKAKLNLELVADTQFREYYDVRLIVVLPGDEDYTEIYLTTETDPELKPRYMEKGYIKDILNINKTLVFSLTKFDEKIVPTESELMDIVDMVGEEFGKKSLHRIIWNDEDPYYHIIPMRF